MTYVFVVMSCCCLFSGVADCSAFSYGFSYLVPKYLPMCSTINQWFSYGAAYGCPSHVAFLNEANDWMPTNRGLRVGVMKDDAADSDDDDAERCDHIPSSKELGSPRNEQ